MDIEIQMLGTGNAFAKKYYQTNALVRCNGFRLLIDCGATAPRSLYEMGIRFDEIDAIFVTHLHADHIGGLEELAFRMYYEYKKRPVLYIPGKLRQPLWNHSLKGGLINRREGFVSLDNYFEVIEMAEGVPVQLHDGFTLEAVRTKHIPGKISYGIVFNDNLFYSADTIFDRKLLDYIHKKRKCRYIIHDCQFHAPGIVHASLDQLLTLPEDLQRKMLLMHYEDSMEAFIGKTGFMTIMEQHKPYRFAT